MIYAFVAISVYQMVVAFYWRRKHLKERQELIALCNDHERILEFFRLGGCIDEHGVPSLPQAQN